MIANADNNDKKQKLCNKYHNKCGKEKARQYYMQNKDVIKEKARTRYQNLSEEEKELKRQYSRERYKRMAEAVKSLI